MALTVKARKNAKELPAKATGKASAKVTGDRVEEQKVKASKYRGVNSGLRVMEFQDSTFAAQSKEMLTDTELAALWRAEFPQAVAFTEFHVKGARRDYNAGRHSTAYRDQKPATPLAEVKIGEDKKRRFVTAADTAQAEKPKAKAQKKGRAETAAA